MSKRAGFIIPPILLTLGCGVLGWRSASILELSIFGHMMLAIGAALFAIASVTQKLLARLWKSQGRRLGATARKQHSPPLRARIVWTLVLLLLFAAITVWAIPAWRPFTIPMLIGVAGALIGYAAWQTRGGQQIQWILSPIAGWSVSLCCTMLISQHDNMSTRQISDDTATMIRNALVGFDRRLVKFDELLDRANNTWLKQWEETQNPSKTDLVELGLDQDDRLAFVELSEFVLEEARGGNDDAVIRAYRVALMSADPAVAAEFRTRVLDLIMSGAVSTEQKARVRFAEAADHFRREEFRASADLMKQVINLIPSDALGYIGYVAAVLNLVNDGVINESYLEAAREYASQPGLRPTRRLYASALYNVFYGDQYEGDRSQQAFAELTRFADSFQSDSNVQAIYCRALTVAASRAMRSDDIAGAERHNESLEVVARRFSGDDGEEIRGIWVSMLRSSYIGYYHRMPDGDLVIEQIESIAQAYPDESMMATALIPSYGMAMYAAVQSRDLNRATRFAERIFTQRQMARSIIGVQDSMNATFEAAIALAESVGEEAAAERFRSILDALF